MRVLRNTLLLIVLHTFLAACGGSSSGSSGTTPPPPPPPQISEADAFRFLLQTTFGPKEADIQRVIQLGYEGWLDEQITEEASLQLPFVQSQPATNPIDLLHGNRVDKWFRNVINEDDQLRQRVAFALSEIVVVSQLGALSDAPYAVADYHDTLVRHAFGNYRELMEAVTLHPAMGMYLSMLGNQKPNEAFNIRPDENYARELMQLFAIGLVELNLDGTLRLDANNQPIATYDQQIIEGFAHVFTGWHFAGAPSFEQARMTTDNQVLPMQLYPDFHDTGTKQLLNNVELAANQTGEQDLAMALDNIFAHPNVAPFVSYRLIQRLVTSNPSPSYVERVATVFNDNGSGVKGDLAAVVRAILLDEEARPDVHLETDGKIKEPILRLTQFWRAFDAQSESGVYPMGPVFLVFGQGPLQSPSVFNFFSPFYAPVGEIRDAGLVAPELQIATEYQNTFITNYLFFLAFEMHSEATSPEPDDVLIDISEAMGLTDSSAGLVDHIADKLLAGEISDRLRDESIRMVDEIRNSVPDARSAMVSEVIFFIISSPEFAYQH